MKKRKWWKLDGRETIITRAVEWVEGALWAAAPILALKFLVPSTPVSLMLAAYLVLVLFIVGVCFRRWSRATRSMRWKSEDRCSHCGYLLKGLDKPRCPECGQAFTWPRSRQEPPAAR